MRDLLVAGGGPVGLATALYAARAGLDVAVREPRAGVIDKACGEGLMPGAVAALRDLDVPLDGHPIRGIRYLDTRWSSEAYFRHGDGLGVRRVVLHAALRARAAAAGIVTEHRPVREVVDHGDHLLVDGEPTRYLIAADGLHSPVRRLLGLATAPSHQRRHGLRCHVEIQPWTTLVEVHWAAAGEAYVTPVAEHQVGVAVLTTERRPLAELLGEFPLLAERLRGSVLSRARGAGPLRQRSLRRVAGRVLLVGDAAGYVDAITGEGIALGLAQARAAVAAVVDGQPQRYEREWRRVSRRHNLLTSGLVVATRLPPVRRRIVYTASKLPAVFAAVVDQLATPAGPGPVPVVRAAVSTRHEGDMNPAADPEEREMAEYEQTQQVDAPAEEVFAWLADVAHLPDYLPPVVAASLEGPSDGDNPGQKLRTTLERPGDDGGSFTAEGYVAVDQSARRMEWGAESGRDYSGFLTVADSDGGSKVTVHLSLGERSAEADIASAPGDRDPLQEGIAATMESIRRQIEDGSGKLATPPPPAGADLSLEDNPAVVDER